MLHLLIEVQRRDEQQLLETVVECFGELFARVLLGERQVRGELAQLSGPAFQFDRSFLKRRRGAPPFRDVRHEREGVSAVRTGNVIEADFDWNRRAVRASSNQVPYAY